MIRQTCAAIGCEEPPRARGLCSKHYSRLLRHGDPLHEQKPPAGCGTYGGYQRHKRQGEKPCDGCREAATAYVAKRRATNALARAYDQEYNRARRRALERLADLHRAEYLRILDEERE